MPRPKGFQGPHRIIASQAGLTGRRWRLLCVGDKGRGAAPLYGWTRARFNSWTAAVQAIEDIEEHGFATHYKWRMWKAKQDG